MKNNAESRSSKIALFILLLTVCALAVFPGCSKKHKSDRTVPPEGSLPTGTTGGPINGGGGNPGDADYLDMTWAIDENAAQSGLEFIAGRIRAYNSGLWQGSEGQAYLRNQTIVNNTDEGDVVIERVSGPMGNPPAYCYSGYGGFTIFLSTGEIPAHGFLHELGHGWVGPFHGEEYSCINQSEGVCIMAAMIGSSGEGFVKWCDPSNCVAGQQCWNQIQETHGWAHPGPGGGSEPICNITIQ
ncbi:MAG: hypothetical protein ACYS8W_11345 [Planctomycetota bacterium]